jgi:sulfate permease, SulP family
MPRRNLKQLYKDEFNNYSVKIFRKDVMAGLTVAAVALPLALAFGVSSGASASAGIVTAILAGIVMGLLSGAPYQISGPTGAMSAVLILLAHQYGLQGIWIAGLLSGVLLLIIGLLKLGRFIAFIPAPVITGFTSGIALIIFIGQIDNLFGVSTPAAESALLKMIGYLKGGFSPEWKSLVVGAIVILTMLLWPKKLNARFPSSLLGLILATVATLIFKWSIPIIGEIPQKLLLADHLRLGDIPWKDLTIFVAPAITITALSAVESLLCGSVASKMTNVRLQANQELVAQGIGNMLIPFFGGVPATAAIARTSVGIKSGGQTRVVSLVHAVILLASMFILGPIMGRIPLSALAGVLMVTAVRMNEWESIRYIFGKRFKTAMLTFSITMVATIMLDLTKAILVGAIISALAFINQISNLTVDIQDVDAEKLRAKGIETNGSCNHIKVAFVTGPLFFAATGIFNEAFTNLKDTHALILSMRGVPLIDTSGLETLRRINERIRTQGGTLMIAGLHANAQKNLERGGLVEEIGADNLFWSSDQAIVEAEKRGCKHCEVVQ